MAMAGRNRTPQILRLATGLRVSGLNFSDSWVQRQTDYKESEWDYLQQKWNKELKNR